MLERTKGNRNTLNIVLVSKNEIHPHTNKVCYQCAIKGNEKLAQANYKSFKYSPIPN